MKALALCFAVVVGVGLGLFGPVFATLVAPL